jgi:hypothetical protein
MRSNITNNEYEDIKILQKIEKKGRTHKKYKISFHNKFISSLRTTMHVL